LKAEADLKANIRKQLSDLKAKIVECQCGSSMVHGETRSRKRDAIPWKSGLKTTKCFIQPHPPNDPPDFNVAALRLNLALYGMEPHT
jgi:hypothetical protein